jgi:hypothetical protein
MECGWGNARLSRAAIALQQPWSLHGPSAKAIRRVRAVSPLRQGVEILQQCAMQGNTCAFHFLCVISVHSGFRRARLIGSMII